MLFHTHTFLQSDVPEILYCMCGKTKDLHRHIWEMNSVISEISQFFPEGKRNIGTVLKCKICGELKTFNSLENL